MTTTQQPELPALPDTPYDLHYEWPDDEDGFGGSEVIGEDGYTADQMRAYAQAAVLADRERRIPEGWALVPIKPTEHMVEAGYAAQCEAGRTSVEEAYEAMLCAAPGAGEGVSAGAGGGPKEVGIERKSLSGNESRLGQAGADGAAGAAGAGAVACSFCGTHSTELPNKMRVIATDHGAICEGCHEIAGRVFEDAAAPSKEST
jgi:hypothetical protein